jgi:hypothetical protein
LAVEPLSPNTLNIRRNLLVASLAGITYKAFDVSADSVTLFDSSVHVDKRAIAFLLIVTIAWLTLHFAVRYFIDMMNLEDSPHQAATQAAVIEERQHFRTLGQAGLAEAITRVLPPNYNLGGSQFPNIDLMFQNCEKSSFPINESLLHLGDPQASRLVLQKLGDPNQTGPLDPIANRKIYELPIQTALEYLRQYQRRYTLLRWRQRPRRYSVWSLYAISNYLLEGVAPLILALVALSAMYNAISLRGLLALLPSVVR